MIFLTTEQMFGMLSALMKPIGTTRKKILEFVRTFMAAHVYPPTVRDIAGSLRLAASTVHEHLSHLRDAGHLVHDPRLSRSLRLPGHEVMGLPLIGRIAAGGPILAVEEWKETIPLPRDLAQGGDFIIQVAGDSMTGAGIHDRDHVVIRKQESAADGDIVAALLGAGEEVTLKKFYKRKGRIILEAANPKYADIQSTDVKILGKVVGLFRKY